jgi:hypothetical protein
VTIYVCGIPSRLCEGRYALWADTQDELFRALLDLNADWHWYRAPQQPGHWEHARITPAQFADVVMMGARVTDFCGPAEWLAMRSGNLHHLAWIKKHRAAIQRDHEALARAT